MIKRILGTDVLDGLDIASNDPTVVQDIIAKVGVWLPLSVYYARPVLLPWAVRDLKSRPTNHPEGLNEWGAPDAGGYFRDDNSLVKGLIRTLSITGRADYQGARLGTGFVAAHIWRVADAASVLTTRVSDLYTFAPNIVWLPSALAKRSDVEGGVVQHVAQAMAWAIYRQADTAPRNEALAASCWARLQPSPIKIQPVDTSFLNWFVANERFFKLREKRIREVADGIDQVLNGLAIPNKVVARRYTAGLPAVEPDQLKLLRGRLMAFLS